MNFRLSHACTELEIKNLCTAASRHIVIYKERASERLLALSAAKCRVLAERETLHRARQTLVDKLLVIDERVARFPVDDRWALLEYLQVVSAPLVNELNANHRQSEILQKRMCDLTTEELAVHASLNRYKTEEELLLKRCATAAMLANRRGEFPEKRMPLRNDALSICRDPVYERFCSEIDAISTLCCKYTNIVC